VHGRIDNPALTVPGALKALQDLAGAARQGDIPETTLYLVELRASQINGCGVCVDIHSRELKHAGEPDERINTVAVWRDVSHFTEAERAALALTEAAARLADRPDAVPEAVWNEAARHYDEAQLAALVLAIAAINTWNRLNVTTRQIGGDWVGQWLASSQGDKETACPGRFNSSRCQVWRAARRHAPLATRSERTSANGATRRFPPWASNRRDRRQPNRECTRARSLQITSAVQRGSNGFGSA
jgi:AhpD family alkylhydroperoxidase